LNKEKITHREEKRERIFRKGGLTFVSVELAGAAE
jgi:hypothetical protein